MTTGKQTSKTNYVFSQTPPSGASTVLSTARPSPLMGGNQTGPPPPRPTKHKVTARAQTPGLLVTGKTRNKETLQTSTPEAPARRQGRSIKTQDRRAGGAAAQNFSGEKGGASTWPLDPRGHGTEKTPPTKHALQRSPVRAQPTREDWPRYRPTFKCRTPSPADVPRAHFPALHRPRRALLSCSHCNRLTAFEHSHPSS